MKKILLSLIATAAIAVNSQATVIFDGGTDTVLMAATTSVALAEPTNGTWTLTSSDAAQAGYIFGNFNATTLANVGESITLSFTTTNWPGAASPGDQITPISFGLFGAGASLVTSNTTLGGFSGYEGFARVNPLNTTGYNGFSASNVSNLASPQSGGGGYTAITGANGSTGTGSNRFDYNDTAAFTLVVTRTASSFEVGGSINVTGGTGTQTYNLGTFTPGSGFQLGDSFTTFAIGINGNSAATQMDSGRVMTFSNITVDYAAIPEPSTLALIAGSLATLAILRRRRQA